ncbi:MAG: class F sortase [Chloroflexi bacterium]|nr:class F sortase [Chloroflexota bacterium]
MTHPPHFSVVVAAAAAVLLAASACAGGNARDEVYSFDVMNPSPTVATPTPTPTPEPSPTPSPTVEPTPTPAPALQAASGGGTSNEASTGPAYAPAAPRRSSAAVTGFRIPSQGVSAPIENIGILGDGTLDSPHNPHAVGWYFIYDSPGEPGNAVFAAHVDYYPNIIGPFNQVAALGGGAEILVSMSDGAEYRYQVVRNTRYSVYDIPMGYVIWPGDRPGDAQWITMITCGGEFRATTSYGAGEYLQRDVVVARRVQ